MMPESRDPESVIELAEQALAAGDYASAEHFLREAARVTEARSGPLSPYLANTLNNLGVVSEMQNNADEAESCYRKAYEIAAATLPPDHPFVATSRKNLTDLCAARGKPVEAATFPVEPLRAEPLRVVPPLVEPLRAEPVRVEPVIQPAPPVATAPIAPPPPRRAARRAFPTAVLLVPLFLGALVATVRLWPETGSNPPQATVASPAEKPEVTATAGQDPAKPPAAVKEPLVKHEPPAVISSPGAPAVLTARVCRTLNRSSSASDDWPCDAATGQVSATTLFFYTRLKTPRDTEVQHRWYHDDALYQSVELPVRANQAKGFRTYSRYTIKSGSSGNWRVELLSNDGALLYQEQFVVR